MRQILILLLALILLAPEVFSQSGSRRASRRGSVQTSAAQSQVQAQNQYTTNYAGTEYYVSSTGNDSNNGTTPATAWKTLSKVNSGTYSAGDAILLNSVDTFAGTITMVASGNSTNAITIAPYGDNTKKPVITGFTTVTGWTNEGGGIYSKVLSAEINPEIATINGVQYAMGRTPNADRYSYDVNDYFHIDSYSGNTQITDTEVPAATTNWTGAEIVVRTSEKTDWKRKSITNHVSNTLTFADLGEAPADGYGYFIQKDLRTLNQFGEWYYGGGKFYMYFGSANPVSYVVKVATKDMLINTADHDYLTIKYLKLEGATGRAIEASNSAHVIIDNCSFDFNYTAILAQTSPDMRITNNTILRSSDRAIYNHWRGDGYYIAYNTIDSTGLIIGAANGAIDNKTMSAIYAGYAYQSTSPNKGIIEYNIVRQTGFYGITFGGDSAIARYNFVDGYCLRLADGGGIHKTGRSSSTDTTHYRNMQIVDNIILNGANQTDAVGFPAGTENTQINGIYADVYTFDIKINRNTIANSANGIYILGLQNLEVNNNTLYNCDYGIKFHKRADASDLTLPIRNLTGSGNKVINDQSGTKPLVSFKDVHADSLKRFGTYNNNYYSHVISNNTPFEQSVVYTKTNLNLAQWKTATGEDAGAYLTWNKGSNTIFDYNNTSSNKTVNITGSYTEADSTEYTTSYTLQPYKSIVLFKDTVTTVDIDSIYAAYPLNANAQDSVASQDGTVTGASLITSGKFKGAYDFTTNTDNIYFPVNTSALTAADSSYSVSFWVKLDNTASTLGYAVYLFSDIKTGTSYKMALQINTSNTLVFQTRNTALSVYTVNSATGAMATTGSWYNIIINVPSAGETGQIYINGARSSGGSQNQFAGASRTSDYRFYASKYTGTSGFDGKMDDIVIRRCWTTAAEAEYIYNSGAGRYYPFTGQ